MADRFPAQIWIGGKVSRTACLLDFADGTTLLEGLISALNTDGASHDFGDKVIPNDCTEAELLDRYIGDDDVLNLKDDQAVNGEFTATETFCFQHDIPFDRWSDHYCEYDAENAHFRPGMNSVMVTYSDSSGKEIVDGEMVRKALTNLIKYKVESHRNEFLKRHHLLNAIRLLESACPDKPDELKYFEIVE